jgi:hypothetical protein
MRIRRSAALVLALGAGSLAHAQSDPFGALHQGQPGATSGRSGATSVSGAVGRSYAGSDTGGLVSLAQLEMTPANVGPFAPRLQPTAAKFLTGRPKIAVPTYGLGFVRGASASASAAGAGSSITPRRTKIATRLVGLTDEAAAALADEAYRDLTARLAAAGFEVVPAETLQALPQMQNIARHAGVAGSGDPTRGWVFYAPAQAPLIKGYAGETGMAALAASRALLALGHVSKQADAVLLLPRLVIDYVALESTGRRMYVGSAHVEAELKFALSPYSRTDFLYGNERGGAMPGAFTTKGFASEEPFGILVRAADRSDSVGLHNALAGVGFGSLYRQSLVYDAEVSPKRFAALTRAAFQGYNAALVAEIRRARGAAQTASSGGAPS